MLYSALWVWNTDKNCNAFCIFFKGMKRRPVKLWEQVGPVSHTSMDVVSVSGVSKSSESKTVHLLHHAVRHTFPLDWLTPGYRFYGQSSMKKSVSTFLTSYTAAELTPTP